MKLERPIVHLLILFISLGLPLGLAGCSIRVLPGGITIHLIEPPAAIPPATPTPPPDAESLPAQAQLWRFDLAPNAATGPAVKSRFFSIDFAGSQNKIFSDIADPNFINDVTTIQNGMIMLALGREVTSLTASNIGTIPPNAQWILLTADPRLLATDQWSEMLLTGDGNAPPSDTLFTVVHKLHETKLPLQATTPQESLNSLTATVNNYANMNPNGKALWIDFVLLRDQNAQGETVWLQYDFIGVEGGAGDEAKRKRCCQKCGCCGENSEYCQKRGCVL